MGHMNRLEVPYSNRGFPKVTPISGFKRFQQEITVLKRMLNDFLSLSYVEFVHHVAVNGEIRYTKQA